MRKPNEDDLSGDVTDTGSVGDGFSAVVDFSDSSYGNGFADDYTDDGDESFDNGSTDGLDVEDTSFGSNLSESEAEAILEDMLDESYGPSAGEMVESLEESTGMSAVEILEDIIRQELGGSDEDAVSLDGGSDAGVGALDPFDAPELPEADLTTPDDLDLTGDRDVDLHDLHEAAHPFDFNVTD